MKTGFFLKLARSNISKNRRFFLPRILSEAGLLCVFYIVFTLRADERILQLRGGQYIEVFMSIGVVVMMLLSVILLFYINSFLMKQRKREFGVYNILGLEKRHICRVLFHETALSSLASVVLGLAMGTLFYKLCSLLICQLLNAEIVLGFYFINARSLALSGAFFLVLDVMAYGVNCVTIARLKPVELLSSANVGEREPKVKWPLLVLGLLALGGGYYISLTTQNPLKALVLFFVAVILVIIGTYFLFVAGSIFVLKALKKNKRFYYNKKHMPAVSGLLYRMKQNAVGLASIAILATGVLVMISTTVSLYAGAEETVKRNYPQDYYLSARYLQWSDEGRLLHSEDMPRETLLRAVEQGAEKNGLTIKEIALQEYLTVSYIYENDTLTCERVSGNAADNLKGLSVITYITEEMYRSLGGEALNLAKDEIAVCPMDIRQSGFDRPTLTIGEDTYQIKTTIPLFPISSGMEAAATNSYGIVVEDESVLAHIFDQQKAAYGEAASDYTRRIAASFAGRGANGDVGEKLERDVEEYLKEAAFPQQQEPGESLVITGNTVWGARESVTAMCGALLFLGIILGLVCLFATVLIVYYKQISEGYEDRVRFQIMQKVGMSRREVKSTINSQVLLVFFLPLVVAGMHLAFAFPILEKVLHILLLSSTSLFVICSLVTFGVFAAVYTLIYMATARTYYKIVR
ncbi:MAG: FtsX-like permease family protein [Oscillospiraceae bacterium]